MLRTERLLLREFVEADFDAVHAYATDLEVVRYMPWGPNTESDTTDFLVRTAAGAAADPRAQYQLAVVRLDDDTLLGGIGLDVDADGDRAVLGYCLARGAWGHGFATEAGVEMLRLGFDVLGVHRISAGCDPDNSGSISVLERLGMTLEGRHRQDTKIRGEWRDTLVYAILESEWSP